MADLPPDAPVKSSEVSNTTDEPDDTEQAASGNGNISEAPKLSKKQMKKRKRFEEIKRKHKMRKEAKKEQKRLLAAEKGIDLDQVRAETARRTAEGTGHQKREEEWERNRGKLAATSFRVVLDCSFNDKMTEKEVSSLALQVRYCYGANKKSKHPCQLCVTSAEKRLLDRLNKVHGFDEWHKRAFTLTVEPLEAHFSDRLQDVVYLTSDSETVLKDLDDSKIYVIGGIVDRNRLKRLAIDRANSIKVSTARLPINEYLETSEATRVLTCNHVCEILLKFRERGRDWQKALLDVLPDRKDFKAK